ncbi:YcxB family protein [Mucilaginibacter limnophilus]|uniref:YcxB family protein n=1 Tax=Mucilaginibacter limnophilus TaxID=1932778 RepID=A0A437MZI3_9SPHI|nr:YcxB family protein [Mucilaginibacter limnophilus]RVU03067.1 YcxB family protein [Mucilaginibacter limnophilus]
MTYTYILTKADHVTYLLHNASTKKSVKKQLSSSWAWISLAFTLIGILFYLSQDTALAITFFGIAITAFLFYPYYLKQRYVKHYTKHVNEVYKDKDATSVYMEITDDELIAGTDKGESKIRLSAIENIAETGQHLFVYISGGQGLIIPKTIPDFNAIKSDMESIAKRLKIPYQTDLEWRWK